MKTIRHIFTFLFSLKVLLAAAQTNLQPGDLMFVGYQYNAPDGYAFVVLKELAPGTKVIFTDKSIIGTNPVSFCPNENEVEWTSPSTPVAVGTVVVILNDPPNSSTSVCNIGTATGALSGLAAAGDQIFAYQTSSGNVINFIAAISSAGFDANCLASSADCGTGTNNNNTCLPPTLAGTQYALAFSGLQPFGFYSGPTTFQNVGDVYTALNAPANWTRGPQNQPLPEPWFFNISTALNRNIRQTAFAVYPNPSNGNFTVRTDEQNQNATLKVSNILGAHLQSVKLNGQINKLSIAEPGIYFIQLISASGKTIQTEKVIVK